MMFFKKTALWQGLSKIFHVGPREYLKQLNRISDTKVGTLKGVDRFGNKYYENVQDEIIMRTRWVAYNDFHHHMDQLEPGWRAWLVYTLDKTPNELSAKEKSHQATPQMSTRLIEAHTGRPSAYVPYSTVRPRVESWTWQPQVKERV